MKIDERLEKLAERHEALRQSVELTDGHEALAKTREITAGPAGRDRRGGSKNCS